MDTNPGVNVFLVSEYTRVNKRLTTVLFCSLLLWLTGIAPVAADATYGAPVEPIAVQVEPGTLRGLDLIDTYDFPAEGEPLPTEPPPPRSPIADPTIQLLFDPLPPLQPIPLLFDQLSAPIVNVPGMTFGNGPPDTIGDIGANHYVQMINSTTVQVFDKDGNPDPLGVISLNSLWQAAGQAGTVCDSGRGDPTVVYDHLADRWLVSQFAPSANTGMCIAISQTPDPTAGSWFLYYFNLGADPDYPKIGVWPDGYYMSSYEGANLGVFAFDRVAMVNGQAAGWFKDTIPSLGAPGVRDTRILPSDLDGPPPPSGTPNYFVQTIDGQQDLAIPIDRISVFEFAVDWSVPSGVFSIKDSLPTAGFQVMLCNRSNTPGNNNAVRDCVPQPDTVQNVDALSTRPMMQLKYRNFGGHASMVFNQTIDVSGSINGLLGFTPNNEVAGIRWYELRNDGATGGWSINDQATFAPQPITVGDETELLHRWMGSAAMDKDGNIAIGYSVSNDDDDNGEEVYPGLRYAGRLAGDLPGKLAQGEKIILNGANSVVGTNPIASRNPNYRWGDYAALSVDPVDDCTFWFTSHVVGATNNQRPTQIASFKFLSCDETDLAISKTASPNPAVAGDQLFYEVTVDNLGPNLATDVIVTDTLPAGVAYVVDTAGCDTSLLPVLTCNIGDIPAGDLASFTIKVEVDADLVVLAGNPTTITNTASVSSNQQDTDESNNETSLTIIVEDSADLKITKLCKPDGPMLAGETAICEIFVDNLGASDARNVQVNDTHVANGAFTIGSVTPSQGSCDPPAGGVVTCDLGVLPANVPDNRAIISIELTADEAVDINDTAIVSSDTPDPDTSNNMAMGSISVTALADLALTKGDSPDPVIAGETLTYTLDVTNSGPSTAVNVLIEDIVPAGTSIDSVSAPGGSCNAGVPGDSSQPTTCTFDSLGVGAMGMMTIVVTVLPDTLGILHNDAEVSSATFDNNNSNDLASTDTTVDSEADLVVTKSDSPDPVLAGAPLAYTIDVTNNGPSTSLDVMLSDTLPVEVSFDSASATNGGPCNFVVPNVVECELGDLAPGETVTVFINVTVDPAVPDGTTITNNVNVTSATTDPGGASDSEDTLVNAEADLWIDKTGNFPTGSPSGTILYFLTVHNTSGCSEDDPQVCGDGGPSDALNIVVTDTLPSTAKKLPVEFVSEQCTYDSGAHEVTCTEPVLAAGDSVTFEIQVRAKGNLGEITNLVSVSSSTTDPDTGNNSDALLMTVQGGTGDGGGPGGGRGRGGGPK